MRNCKIYIIKSYSKRVAFNYNKVKIKILFTSIIPKTKSILTLWQLAGIPLGLAPIALRHYFSLVLPI